MKYIRLLLGVVPAILIALAIVMLGVHIYYICKDVETTTVFYPPIATDVTIVFSGYDYLAAKYDIDTWKEDMLLDSGIIPVIIKIKMVTKRPSLDVEIHVTWRNIVDMEYKDFFEAVDPYKAAA